MVLDDYRSVRAHLTGCLSYIMTDLTWMSPVLCCLPGRAGGSSAGVVRNQTRLLQSMLMQHMNHLVTHNPLLLPDCTVPYSKHYMWGSEKEHFVSSAFEVSTDEGPQ